MSTLKKDLTDSAIAIIEAHDADLWVFMADARHFWQFAEQAEVEALYALTEAQHEALLGKWEDEDWYPENFGY